MQRVMAYLDGFSLYHGLKGKGWKKHLWLDLDALARTLAKPEGRIISAKYFTAMVHPTPEDPDKTRRQARYIAALRTKDVRIIFGSFKTRNNECRRCHARWIGYEEKQTDVNIAMEILSDAYQDRFDTMILVSRDGDLVSIVRRIREDFPGKRIILALPPGKASPDLPRYAHAAIHITEAHLKKSQLPDQVVTKSGAIAERPPSWR